MTYTFSRNSLLKLETAHPDLIAICYGVLKLHDFAVSEGHRGKDAQDKAVAEGKSKTPWPTSKHNKTPSLAVDLLPYVNGKFIGWDAPLEQWAYFAGIVMGIAEAKGFKIRWGGNWKRDNDLTANKFDDLPHFEII